MRSVAKRFLRLDFALYSLKINYFQLISSYAAFSAEYVRSMTKQPNSMTPCFSKSRLPSRSLTEQKCCKLTNSLSNNIVIEKNISDLSFCPAGLHKNLKS